MNALARLLSFAGLGLTVVPAFLVFTGALTWGTHALLMLAGTVLWFASAPVWMKGAASDETRTQDRVTERISWRSARSLRWRTRPS